MSSLGESLDPGTEPRSPALQADSLPSEPSGKPYVIMNPAKPLEYYIFRKMYLINCIIHFHCICVSFPRFFVKSNTIQHVLDRVLCFSCAFSNVTIIPSSTAGFYDHCFNTNEIDYILDYYWKWRSNSGLWNSKLLLLKCMLHQDFNTLNTSPCI